MSFGHEHTHELDRSDNEMHVIETIMFA